MSNRHKYLILPAILVIVLMTVGMSWSGQQTQAAGDPSGSEVIVGSNAPDPVELEQKYAADRLHQAEVDREIAQQLQDFYQGIADAQVADYLAGLEAQHQEQLRAEAAKAAQAKAQKPAASYPSSRLGSGRYGAPSAAFTACVQFRESRNNYDSVGGGMYGIIDSTWRANFASQYGVSHSWLASPEQQDAAFYALYDSEGPGPWSPYDGCRA
jgi:muramidase (phage lysozyme)